MTRTRSYPVLRTLSFVLGLALLAPLSAQAQAVPSDAHFRGFELNNDFIVVLAGKELPKAELYLSESARAYLVIASDLPSPLLINAPAGTVETVDLMKVSRRPDGTIDLLADATLDPAGKYQIRENEIEFTVSGKIVRLKQRPYSLGPHTGPALLSSSPVYQRTAKSYNPDPGILKRLKEHKEPVRVLTFFGSWCPHCRRHLPLLMKVEEGLAGSKFKFDYYGLPRPFDGDAEAKKYGITGVPTAILFVGDKEVGRIPATQWSNPEVALDLQLNGPGRSKAR
jgi:thiol-disulfide isomerase/thioredoxin